MELRKGAGKSIVFSWYSEVFVMNAKLRRYKSLVPKKAAFLTKNTDRGIFPSGNFSQKGQRIQSAGYCRRICIFTVINYLSLSNFLFPICQKTSENNHHAL
jgi:hypothetical protein